MLKREREREKEKGGVRERVSDHNPAFFLKEEKEGSGITLTILVLRINADRGWLHE